MLINQDLKPFSICCIEVFQYLFFMTCERQICSFYPIGLNGEKRKVLLLLIVEVGQICPIKADKYPAFKNRPI
jgi:hypothetical protein